jgi:carbon storage regulator
MLLSGMLSSDSALCGVGSAVPTDGYGSRMLVVTRKKDEKLIIGNEIEIQVLRIGRENVRIGIKAPSHISIYRSEIYEAIKNKNGSEVRSQIPDAETAEKLARAGEAKAKAQG